jgi:hypothetical protein
LAGIILVPTQPVSIRQKSCQFPQDCLELWADTVLSGQWFERFAPNERSTTMPVDIGPELAELKHLTIGELRQKYVELFGEATRTGNKSWLVRRLAWRLQALAEGDLSERARQRAAELAHDADLRLSPPRMPKTVAPPETGDQPSGLRLASAGGRLPPPGTVLVRPYKGRTLQVRILADGFAYEGRVYRSLSAVAKAITGSHCSGYLFFRLTPKGVAS